MNRTGSALPTLAFLASVCAATPVHAQEKSADYPRRPIRIVAKAAKSTLP